MKFMKWSHILRIILKTNICAIKYFCISLYIVEKPQNELENSLFANYKTIHK